MIEIPPHHIIEKLQRIIINYIIIVMINPYLRIGEHKMIINENQITINPELVIVK
jgi:hypothetical protein